MSTRLVQPRGLRRTAVAFIAALALIVGATGCGNGGDTQGRQDPELTDVEAQVAQLRLEVQTLRKELAALAETAVTTTTSGPNATTSSASG